MCMSMYVASYAVDYRHELQAIERGEIKVPTLTDAPVVLPKEILAHATKIEPEKIEEAVLKAVDEAKKPASPKDFESIYFTAPGNLIIGSNPQAQRDAYVAQIAGYSGLLGGLR